MHRLFILFPALLWLLSSCNPPVRLIPRKVKTGLDSVEYAGVVERAIDVDLRPAKFLAKVKVGDLGMSLDCAYPDVLGYALNKSRAIGGNLLVLTEHKRNEVKSNCHTIRGEIYQIPSLEGLEKQIRWHPKRPLMPGDLRGSRPAQSSTEKLPPLHCTISCRVGGDYFKEAVIRTETLFWADSTYLPSDATLTDFARRRAQVHFNLAEMHARRLKSVLVGLGPDLPALTGQFRPITAKQQAALREEAAIFDAELAGNAPDAVLERWEKKVLADLISFERFYGDYVVDLRKKKG
jgi:hypothetical protein